jgi:RNA polymerase sigma factor (sigma-70 family)
VGVIALASPLAHGMSMAVTEASHAAARALDDLYRRHGPEIYRYSLAVLGNHADAEDVTQTTFLNAYRALEQGVHPRKPVNWLLTIASNAIKQRFRQEQSRPHVVELDRDVASNGADDEAPSVGELLTALSKIPPQQREAIVLREFEGRSYKEIAEILGVTTSALETLLFRARRSLTEELTHQLTCIEAQQAISRASDGRLGRKEKRRLEEHVTECPDCAQFARLQHGHRKAFRGLALVPIPLSLTLFKGLEGSAAAATLPAAVGGGASVAAGGTGAAAVGSGMGGAAAGGGGLLAGGLAVKAAAVVAAASIAGGVTVAGVKEFGGPAKHAPGTSSTQSKSHEPHSQRAAHTSANGLAHGKARARGQNGTIPARARGHTRTTHPAKTRTTHSTQRHTPVKPEHPATGTKTRTRTGSTRSNTSRTQPGKTQASKTQPTNSQASKTQPSTTQTSTPTSNGSASGDSQTSSADTTQSAPPTQTTDTESTATTPATTPTTTSPSQSDAHSNKADR